MTSGCGHHGYLQEQQLLLLWSHPQLQSNSVCNNEPQAQTTPVWVIWGHITKSDELKALAVRTGNCLSKSYTHYETLELGRGLERERENGESLSLTGERTKAEDYLDSLKSTRKLSRNHHTYIVMDALLPRPSLDSVLIIVNVYRQAAEQPKPKWITFLSVSVMRVLVLGATIPFL